MAGQPIFELAGVADFQRMLGDILDRGRSEAGRLAMTVEATFASHGGVGNSRFPIAIEDAIAPCYAKVLSDAMQSIVRFAERSDQSFDNLIALARSPLNMFNEYCIERMARLAKVTYAEQTIASARERFQQRTNHAERDLRVGFINGRVALVNESPTSQSRALRLLKEIYDLTQNTEEPVIITDISENIGLSEQESQAAWRYLRDRGLISTYSLQYSAHINSAGIDAIENARRRPDSATVNFPAVTYNIVNNTVHVESAVNSPVQQAGSGSTQHQIVTYSQNQLSELRRTLVELLTHFEELKLDPVQARKARAQITTLEAQLDTEPDPIILHQAGRTLRNIIEGTIASLVAAGIQPVFWTGIADVLGRFFS